MAFPLILHEAQVKDLVENRAIHIDLYHPISVKNLGPATAKAAFGSIPWFFLVTRLLALSPSYTGIIVLSFLTMEHLDTEGEKKLRNAICKPQTPGKATQPLSLLLLTQTMDWAIQVLSPAPTKALSMSYLHSPPTIPIRLSAPSESDLLLMISKLI